MVALTVAQNRFLYNGLDVPSGREGYLYMRLTPEEAMEVFGLKDGVRVACNQRTPAGLGDSDIVFAPSIDNQSKLWPRVVDGLKLYGMTEANVLDMSAFKLSMVSRPRAVAELTTTGAQRQCFGVLCGDAASAIHFWPGRGGTGGSVMATALAHTISENWNGRGLRSADLMMYEATFAAIRHRHADRAWRAMVRLGSCDSRPIHDLIADACLHTPPPRAVMLAKMECRIKRLAHRLAPRLPQPIAIAPILKNLRCVNEETLHVLVNSGAWETNASGGPEFDLARLIG